jgi:hypothetical protein
MAAMKLIGFVFSLVGFAGLLAGAGLEIGAAAGSPGLADHWPLGHLLGHRMMIATVSGFLLLVAGVILFGLAGTQRAVARLAEVVREAIDAPDACPAAPPLLDVPAPPVELDAVRPRDAARELWRKLGDDEVRKAA